MTSPQLPKGTTSITPGYFSEADYNPAFVLRMPGEPPPAPVIVVPTEPAHQDASTASIGEFHLAGKHNQETHGHGGAHEMFASTAEHTATLKQARGKVRDAPVPTQEQVIKARAELEKAKRGEGRAGGDSRGGSAAGRRKQRENLFNEFGGDKKGYVVCHGCGLKLHSHDAGPDNPKGYARLERGKIFTKCQGGGYQLPNLLPECFGCNRGRNDKPVRRENKC
jgi:hypothetical protein